MQIRGVTWLPNRIIFLLLYLSLLIVWAFGINSYAQQSSTHRLHIIPTDTDSLQLTTLLPYNNTYATAAITQQKLPQLLQQLYAQGYLAASFDSLQVDTTATKAYLHLGPPYKWVQLQAGNVPERMLSQAGYREKLYRKQAFNQNQLRALQEKLLRYAEDNGYPFSSIGLQNVQINNNGEVQAALLWDKQQLVIIDSVVINGKAKITNRYLQNYLDLKKGQTYNEKNIQAISTRIRELPFLEERQAADVLFIGKKAKVNLFLKPKKASKFNFLLGIIPQQGTSAGTGSNPNNPDGRQRYQITGEGELHLQNALGAGEILELLFTSYPQNARELKTHVQYPYLPLLPIGADIKFDLYLRDTLYRDVSTYLGLQYLLKGNNYFKAFWSKKNSSILSVDSLKLINSEQLPELLDVKNTLYGIEYNFEQLDYRLNPRKGYTFNVVLGLGTKTVGSNNAILAIGDASNIDFKAQYDSLNVNKFQYQVKYSLQKYWGIGKLSTLKTGLSGAYISNQQTLQNELFRIGGNRTLRGFDEESIFTSMHHIFTLEYRYLLAQNSYFFGFTDIAYLQNKSRNTNLEDTPYGFGLGMSFETKAGVFGISYALGKQADNPINFRNGKIHFGYINYF